MPRKTKDALTNTRIRKAKIKDKQYKLFDGQGLIVLIHPNGSKYFRWRYYIEGREKLLSLGVYPVISLSTAREERLIAEQLLKQGYDPVEHYRKERQRSRPGSLKKSGSGKTLSVRSLKTGSRSSPGPSNT